MLRRIAVPKGAVYRVSMKGEPQAFRSSVGRSNRRRLALPIMTSLPATSRVRNQPTNQPTICNAPPTHQIMHSFRKDGASIVDHHTASQQFLTHDLREKRVGRECPAQWSWIVPPLGGSLTSVFHHEMRHFDKDPRFVYQVFLCVVTKTKESDLAQKAQQTSVRFVRMETERACTQLFGRAPRRPVACALKCVALPPPSSSPRTRIVIAHVLALSRGQPSLIRTRHPPFLTPNPSSSQHPLPNLTPRWHTAPLPPGRDLSRKALSTRPRRRQGGRGRQAACSCRDPEKARGGAVRLRDRHGGGLRLRDGREAALLLLPRESSRVEPSRVDSLNSILRPK